MTNINGNKIGNVVNLSINGKLHKKVCSTPLEANEFYQLIRKAKADPTDENIKAVRLYMNERTRTAMLAGLECDFETGEVFLAGFNTPIPDVLVEVVKDYHENGYPMDAIINFWKLLMINPDVRVRTSLFDFITTHDFSLTDKGYMVVYKAVYRQNNDVNSDNVDIDSLFAEFITNQYLLVKKGKKSPKNYEIVKLTDGTLKAVKNDHEITAERLGNLYNLYQIVINNKVETDVNVDVKMPLYTDMHTRKMQIQLGVPVVMDRKNCDSDPAVDCSYGLHVGATNYVEHFAGSTGVILACLVNPANVVAVPNYDHSKMRVTEYFPFAYATYENGKIDIVEQKYFEDDYCQYEHKEVEKLIAKVKKNEKPIEKAKNAEDELRPMSELLKILETRMFDLDA